MKECQQSWKRAAVYSVVVGKPSKSVHQHQHHGRNDPKDLIVSWVTFCWLADPVGTLAALYNSWLELGGCMLISSLPFLLDSKQEIPEKDEPHLSIPVRSAGWELRGCSV